MRQRRLPGRLRCAAIIAALMTDSALAAGAVATPPAAGIHGQAVPKKVPPAAVAKRPVDINSASCRELKNLPGIGDAQCARIVAGRPYRSKADLVAAKAIPAGTYVSIRHSIIALPPAARRAAR